MCGYCTKEKDGFNLVGGKTIPVEIAGIRVGTQTLDMGISRSVDDNYKLCVYYDVEGEEAISIKTKINYCPFCGEELAR